MNPYKIKRIHTDEYWFIRRLDREAFGHNERGSDPDLHEIFADNIRRSPYYIPELDLVAVTEDGFTYLGHAIFSRLPMGDGGEHVVWLHSLAVRHGEQDSPAEGIYEYQRKGIGTALVMRGLEIARELGYTGCMTCGAPAVYRGKMGFSDCRDLGIGRDASVDDPEGCVFAIELVPGGFDRTSRLLSYAYYDFTLDERVNACGERLAETLEVMLGAGIARASQEIVQLHGGTLGDVRLISGVAETGEGAAIPYRLVFKSQKRWTRSGDPDSWRREYDLYASDFGGIFGGALKWPKCYRAEMLGDETRIWMEYIDAPSGGDLTTCMLERAAEELGRMQGRLHTDPGALAGVACLGDAGFMRREYSQWRPETVEYRYLRSSDCGLPARIREMLIDTQRRSEEIFAAIGRLPVVLCHRDFWIENIFAAEDGAITLIDWDCAGWGYVGEDIASLIVDDTDADRISEYFRRLVPAYRRGLSQHMDIGGIASFHIRDMIIIKFGYRILQEYMFAQSQSVRDERAKALEYIYAMGNE